MPRLLVAAEDLAWFEMDDVGQQVVALVDGARTIAQIAREAGLPLVQTQVTVAALRERGLVGVR